MIYYEVKNERDRVLASSLESCPPDVLTLFENKKGENIRVKNVRNVIRTSENGSVRLLIVDDKELKNSNRGVERVADVYLSLIPEFRKISQGQRQHFDLIVKRFIHNLVDVQKRFKGHLQRLVPYEARERSYDGFVKGIEDRIKGDTRAAADDFGQVAQRATDFDAQFAGLRVISGLAEETRPSLIRINIRKAMFRFQQPFGKEFKEKKVRFNVQIDPEQAERNRLELDPDLLNIALSQFFHNTLKYVRPDSDVTVTANFSDDACGVQIAMRSACIDEDEVDKIFNERYKGRHSGNMAGEGIGMFLVRKALRIMGADIRVAPESKSTAKIDDQTYCNNKFILDFSRKK
jgi:signal transduction histidine kinase